MRIHLPLSKAYFEITNVCNAACTFCPGNRRDPRFVSEKEFRTVLDRLKGRVEYLYFHLMGEPLLHPEVRSFARIAKANGFRVMLTSNGLVSREAGIPLAKDGNLHKISLSLHSYEANAFGIPLEEYLDGCFSLADRASDLGTVCVLRLWNRKAGDTEGTGLNTAILDALHDRFTDEWSPVRCGYRLKPRLFLEWGERFSWPGELPPSDEPLFCYGLRNQIGILSDGTVVPCCLDGEGHMALGNLFSDDLETILSSPRAKTIYDGFSSRRAVEPLCRTCGFATRFR
ncbi:MAG: SPASM domain-containing protein [Clostridia bacterium]|nr:SPASM domain-containing protein [Clostridia bacterium]